MAKNFRKAFYILEFSWGYEARKRFPRKLKNQHRVIDCVTLDIVGFNTNKGCKFQVNANDGWFKIIRSKYDDLDRSGFESIAEEAIEKYIDERHETFHYRDEY